MLAVRTSEAIDVDRRDDRIYRGVVDQDIRGENGRLAIPRGSPVELIVRVAPDNDLVIDVDSVVVNGQRYGMRTDPTRVESQRDLVGSIVGAVTGNEVRGRAVHIHPDTISELPDRSSDGNGRSRTWMGPRRNPLSSLRQ